MRKATIARILLISTFVTAFGLAQVTTREAELASLIAGLPENERESSVRNATGVSKPPLARALLVEGDKRRDKGALSDALSLYRLGLSVAEDAADKTVTSIALDRIGVTHFRQDDYPLALKVLGEALAMRREIGEKAPISETLDNIGRVYQWQEDFAKALAQYRESMAISTEIGDRKGVARTLSYFGSLHSARGELDEAADAFSRALQMREELGDKEGIAIISNSLSSIAYQRADYVGALEYLGRALALFEELGQTQRAGVVRGNLAAIHIELGDYERAMDLTRKSLTIAQAAGNRTVVASELDRIGTVKFYLGDMAGALEFYQKALTESEGIGAKGNIGIRLQNIAGVYDWQGNYDLALDYFERALVLRRSAEDKSGVGDLLNRIGRVHLAKGDYEKALKYINESIAVSEGIGARDSMAQARLSLADLSIAKGELTAASLELEKALKLSEETGNKRVAISELNRLGQVALRNHDYRGALERSQRAIELAQGMSTDVGLPDAYTTEARALRALGEIQRAEQSLAKAISVSEKFRDLAAGTERARQTLFAELVSPYYEMVDLLVTQNRLPEALLFGERAKGRVLLDVLAAGRTEVGRLMTATEAARERQLANEQASLNAQLMRESRQDKANADKLKELEGKLASVRRSYEAFETQLYVAHPELRLRRSGAPVIDYAQVQEMVPDSRSALIEFMVMDGRTLLFVLARDTLSNRADLQVFSIDIKRSELAKRVEAFRASIETRDVGFATAAAGLYELLLGPARKMLGGRTQLTVVPDDCLWGVPFQALQPARGRYLLEQAFVSYAPSLSVLRAIEVQADKRKASPQSARAGALLAIGNPLLGEQTLARADPGVRRRAAFEPLPEAEREAKSLGVLYRPEKTQVYTGAEATESRVKKDAGGFATLHFATHGIFNNKSPMYSNIALAEGGGEDGLLEAWEIMKLDLNADLVVLSACETGRGGVQAGEGLIGLSWALFVAGSPATVVSQWKVASTATQRLMLDFHRQLRAMRITNTQKVSSAAALRLASLKMLRDPGYRHPFYWAGFVVVGKR